jgi:hypothetical protein
VSAASQEIVVSSFNHEVYQTGQPVEVCWTDRIARDKYDILYTRYFEEAPQLYSTHIESNYQVSESESRANAERCYTWHPPLCLAPGKFLFKICPAGSRSCDNSATNGWLQLVKGSVNLSKIIGPSSGGTYPPGSAIDVTWTNPTMPPTPNNFYLVEKQGGGSNSRLVLANKTIYPGENGDYSQPIDLTASPLVSGKTYAVKVCPAGCAPCVASDWFTPSAVSQKVEVTRPASQSTVSAGQTVTLGWRATAVTGPFNVYLAGVSGSQLVASLVNPTTSSSEKTYNLLIPNNLTVGSYRVRVCGTGAASNVCGLSTGSLAVGNTPPPPPNTSLTVSCLASPMAAILGGGGSGAPRANITWKVTHERLNGRTYSYSWSGSDGLTGETSVPEITKTYYTTGLKSARVTVTESGSLSARRGKMLAAVYSFFTGKKLALESAQRTGTVQCLGAEVGINDSHPVITSPVANQTVNVPTGQSLVIRWLDSTTRFLAYDILVYRADGSRVPTDTWGIVPATFTSVASGRDVYYQMPLPADMTTGQYTFKVCPHDTMPCSPAVGSVTINR